MTIRVYWIRNDGRAEEMFCTSHDERKEKIKSLKTQGIESGWEYQT